MELLKQEKCKVQVSHSSRNFVENVEGTARKINNGTSGLEWYNQEYIESI